MAVKLWLPSASFVVIRVQAPPESAVAVPTWVDPSNTFTVLFAAAVPLSVSVLSSVMWSPTTPLSVENEAIVGAEGGVDSAAIVTATENQYTVSGGIALVRVVPTASWLNPRDRTSIGFTGSFGKITQPAYLNAGVLVPAVVSKSAIYHAEAERDEYLSPRFFGLAQTAFDHNFGQDLDLQQIYGGGFGWTFYKTPTQEADVKGTIQYEKQQFITSGSGTDKSLIGSTFAASYVLRRKLVTYVQGLAFIPAYNEMKAYSANETNTFAFPAYKNLSFSVSTMDSYLNDPPASLPPTKRNSFQFTMGLTYAFRPKD